MNDISSPTCIYCGGPGPFTAEHVIPASVGADDVNWLLKDCVCQSCNTGVFSPLELLFARSSLFYLSRLALQPSGRKRGSKSEPPKAQLQESVYFDPDLNLILEAIIVGGDGLNPTALPQIHLLPGPGTGIAVPVYAPDKETLEKFFSDLGNSLGDHPVLVEKNAGAVGGRYVLHQLQRTSGGYRIASSNHGDRVPAGAIWYAPLAPVRSYAASTGARVSPRVFRHESGSLTCRSDDIDRALVVLKVVSGEIDRWSVPAGTPTQSTPTPAYRQTLVYDHAAYCRVLAKTSGLAVIRQSGFDRAKRYVLQGRPRLVSRYVGDDEIPASLAGLASTHHLIGIEVERRLGMEVVRAIFKFYGGPVQKIRLAARCGGTFGVTPVWLSVDYVNHRVQRLASSAT